MSDSLRIQAGEGYRLSVDEDGYPAVKVENHAFVEETGLITVSGVGYDAEAQVRELAVTLTRLAEAMGEHRRAETTS